VIVGILKAAEGSIFSSFVSEKFVLLLMAGHVIPTGVPTMSG